MEHHERPIRSELPPDFYLEDAVTVAKGLLGKLLIVSRPGSPQLAGRIVETEAYMGKTDKAAHSCGGRRTARTEVLYGPGGGIYVYLIYGMYSCLNIVCNAPETPEAALIRAIEPVAGIEEMCRNRFGCTTGELVETKGRKALFTLTNGPGKLCRALGLTKEDSGQDVFNGVFHISVENPSAAYSIVETTRIGVDYAGADALLPYRYYIKGNPYVSKK